MADALPLETAMGTVTLTSTDAEALATFYERVVGLERRGAADGAIDLGAPAGAAPLLRIVDAPDAPAARGVNGLFHLAVLMPDRPALAHALRRVADGGWRLTGASDHLVSEALYLRDPEGNGVELYHDRPASTWTRQGDHVQMTTTPLDLEALHAAADEPDTSPTVRPGTRIGHVHLSTSPVPAVEAFYRDVLGFHVTTHLGTEATFLAAGDYHHHLAANRWAGSGLVAPPDGVAGLRSFEILVPDADARSALAARAAAADALVSAADDGMLELRDPAGLRALVLG